MWDSVFLTSSGFFLAGFSDCSGFSFSSSFPLSISLILTLSSDFLGLPIKDLSTLGHSLARSLKMKKNVDSDCIDNND